MKYRLVINFPTIFAYIINNIYYIFFTILYSYLKLPPNLVVQPHPKDR